MVVEGRVRPNFVVVTHTCRRVVQRAGRGLPSPKRVDQLVHRESAKVVRAEGASRTSLRRARSGTFANVVWLARPSDGGLVRSPIGIWQE
jgi:hypothetical protein